MKRVFKKLIGLILLSAGIVGFALALVAGIVVWNYRGVAAQSIDSRLGLVNQALSTTDETLRITKGSLQASLDGLIAAQAAISATAVTMSTIDPIVNSATILLRDDLPKTVTAAKNSLTSAQASAKVMDEVLKALTIFNRDLYNPPVPLDVALKQLADSLNGLTVTLSDVSKNLSSTRTNLQTTQQSIQAIAASLEDVKTNVAQYQQMVDQYRAQNLVLQNEITSIQTHLPEAITYAMWGAILLLVWLALAQLGLTVQGVQLLFG
jgi:chromosome segregation ATPase